MHYAGWKILEVLIGHHRNWWNIILFLTIITFSKDFGSEKNAEHFSHNSVRGCSYFYSYAGNWFKSSHNVLGPLLNSFFCDLSYFKSSLEAGNVLKRIANSIDWRTDKRTKGRTVGPIFKRICFTVQKRDP